ncbi:unnamed protein product [Calicophoron daubneyi]|uniref:Cilia- and flagella-associated protein 251 n=1 Tax=Calicophoron daubneyi TaxID=300641 RepID=A0AAV2T0R6_CALDB
MDLIEVNEQETHTITPTNPVHDLDDIPEDIGHFEHEVVHEKLALNEDFTEQEGNPSGVALIGNDQRGGPDDDASRKEKPIQSENARFWLEPPKDQVLYPLWTFGFNHSVPVINLSKKASNVVFYASSHLVILYDIDYNMQRVLRGHCNAVSCLTCSGDKRWLASGDSGPDSAVIIWDGKTGEPVRTMLSPHKNGVAAIALTDDARYLATLSADDVEQEFAIWNWTTGEETPLCSVKLDTAVSSQRTIEFKPGDYFHVATNSQHQVVFYDWSTSGKIEAYAPPLSDEDFNKRIGNYSYTRFMPGKNVALTATSQGLLVIWVSANDSLKKDYTETIFKKVTKLVPLHEKAITYLYITKCRSSGYAIVTGDSAGIVKFFDMNFMLLFWYQNLNGGPIVSVTFASRGILDEDEMTNWRSSMYLESTQYPQCSTIEAERFVVEDFIVTTAHANMIGVTVDGGILKIIHQDNHDEVTGLSANPILSNIAVCSYTGKLKIFDYNKKTVVAMRDFGTNDPIQTCKYDRSGHYLAVGFVSGYLRVVNSVTLLDVTSQPFTYGRGAITHADFDPQNEFCAFSDSAFTTTLLCRSSQNETDEWTYVGRVRVHHREITDILFWCSAGSKQSRLFSLGADQTLCEYDLYASTLHNIVVLGRYRVEQLATPLCLSSLPPCYKEDFLCISTSASKMKLFNSTSFMCRKTLMAFPPGVEFVRVAPLPSTPSDTAHFLVCMSDERLALVMMPLDGDPLKTTNLIAHPSGARGPAKGSDLAVSQDGQYVFTAGGPDNSVHMWGVNSKILEERVKKASEVKRRFYSLISPQFLEELKDYYYYSMLRTQGLKCLDTRETSLTIPISEIPFVMRAVGFYPTEEEVESMINEIKYSRFSETGSYVTDIDLDTFIQMYCNHRPYQGILFKDVERDFHKLCQVTDPDSGKLLTFRDPREKVRDIMKLPPEFLFSYLQALGEPISEDELAECLSVLLGCFPEGGRPEATEPISDRDLMKSVDNYLPMFLNAETFVKNILGLEYCIEQEKECDEDAKLQGRKTEATDSITNLLPNRDSATEGIQTE